jgi:hypothetical protein
MMTTLDDVAALARGLRDNDRWSADLEELRARLLLSFSDRVPPERRVGPSARAHPQAVDGNG